MTTYLNPKLLTPEQRKAMARKMGLSEGYFDDLAKSEPELNLSAEEDLNPSIIGIFDKRK